MKHLVFVHGRAQQDKDPAQLKDSWISALEKGLREIGKTLPAGREQIHFPFYGDTLRDLCQGLTPEQAASVIMQGVEDDAERLFAAEVIREIAEQQGITEENAPADVDVHVIHQGVENWPVMLRLLRALDKVPGVNAEAISLATHDVYQYMRQSGISLVINKGVTDAIGAGDETVLVSHSLGTVVCYNLLRTPGLGANIARFVTLGSPLAITAIKRALAPLGMPGPVRSWFNGRDKRDVVALYPLTGKYFPVQPITDKSTVHNDPDDPHNVEDYLRDPDVAEAIYEALR